MLIYLISFISLLFSPSYSSAEQSPQSFYTIQAGSFIDKASALKEFHSILQRLNENELEYLRVEKIGRFYSVRIGRFEDIKTAKRFLKRIKTRLPDSIIIKAYIIEERIVKRYTTQEMPKIVDRGFESLDDQIKRISSLVNKRDYEKALDEVKVAMVNRQDNPELNGWYGAILLKMNQPSEALGYLKKATELSPDVSDYHSVLGYCLFFLNNFDEAIDEFNKALKIEPSHIDALTGLAITYAKIGKKDEVMDIYNKLKGLDRNTANKILKIIR